MGTFLFIWQHLLGMATSSPGYSSSAGRGSSSSATAPASDLWRLRRRPVRCYSRLSTAMHFRTLSRSGLAWAPAASSLGTRARTTCGAYSRMGAGPRGLGRRPWHRRCRCGGPRWSSFRPQWSRSTTVDPSRRHWTSLKRFRRRRRVGRDGTGRELTPRLAWATSTPRRSSLRVRGAVGPSRGFELRAAASSRSARVPSRPRAHWGGALSVRCTW
mmetsp:Transcript_51186/g.165784  ORF Transcript_51186/g.165784 Transcript_51186/m.165784 type:complete len:215 (-) Transcript_51186:1184-1828(-)